MDDVCDAIVSCIFSPSTRGKKIIEAQGKKLTTKQLVARRMCVNWTPDFQASLNISMQAASVHYRYERVLHELRNSKSHRSSLTIQSDEVSFLP